MTVFGYARVNTTGQNLATQKSLLAKAGVTEIRAEKVSGVAAKRPVLARLLDDLEPGDVLVVTKLDRLARSTLDLLRTIDRIGKAGASFRSLGEPWADTASPAGRLMLTVLGGVADYADTAVMRSWAAGMQAWPGFQRREAPHNPGRPRRVSP